MNPKQHQTGSDAPKEPTRFHDGDPCARAPEAVCEIEGICVQNTSGPRQSWPLESSKDAAVIRREIAKHYEKEIERLGKHALTIKAQDCEIGRCVKEIDDLRTRLATAEADSKRLMDLLYAIGQEAHGIRDPLRVVGGDVKAAQAQFEKIRQMIVVTFRERGHSFFQYEHDRAAQQQHKEE